MKLFALNVMLMFLCYLYLLDSDQKASVLDSLIIIYYSAVQYVVAVIFIYLSTYTIIDVLCQNHLHGAHYFTFIS